MSVSVSRALDVGRPWRGLRSKIPALTEALTGRFTDDHAFSAGVHLDPDRPAHRSDRGVTARIEVVIEPFQLTSRNSR